MKRFINPVAPRIKSLSLLVAAIGLFFVSSENAVAQSIYQIQNQKITLEGSGKLKDWKPVVGDVGFSGRFIAHQDGIEDLSGFGFGLSLLEAPQNTDKYGAIIHQAMSKSGNNEIEFQQQKIMVLPIMQTIYISGVVKMIDGDHLSSMFLHYQIEDDNRITVKGQQIVWMYEFGVNTENLTAYHKDDQVTINLEFNLVKEQPVYASNISKVSSAVRPSSTTR
jgi:hypothetical protein